MVYLTYKASIKKESYDSFFMDAFLYKKLNLLG